MRLLFFATVFDAKGALSGLITLRDFSSIVPFPLVVQKYIRLIVFKNAGYRFI